MDFQDIPEATEDVPVSYPSYDEEPAPEVPQKGYDAFPDPEPEDALA
jgi:hypothetical protein